MAGKGIEIGPTGDTVRHNIARVRRARGLAYTELSKQLAEAGRLIPPLGLRRIEDGERRVDVDDLVALAAVLWVDPVVLMAPPLYGGGLETEVTGLGRCNSSQAVNWLGGQSLIAPTAPRAEVVTRTEFALTARHRQVAPAEIPADLEVTAAPALLQRLERMVDSYAQMGPGEDVTQMAKSVGFATLVDHVLPSVEPEIASKLVEVRDRLLALIQSDAS
ncbi:MAG: helix-turn-helix transcriptional regulator [Actinobacteria bacterium]|nr:helix-turn-helix transcriptional regulator [Actinomycetota bacterium]MCG2802886.1 helix-turn-helix transcriptional regulator [Cellulomonas sp.]